MQPRVRHLLLVIDLLNDFFPAEGRLASLRSSIVAAVDRLTTAFRENRQPIIWVRQEFAADLSDAFLDVRRKNAPVTIAGTDGCQFLPELRRLPYEKVIVKKRYSAFFRTDLDDTLAALRPDMLILAGVNTHACIRMTAIDAYQRDYPVIVASDAVASYDAEQDQSTRRYLDGKIVRFMTSDEIAGILGPSGT